MKWFYQLLVAVFVLLFSALAFATEAPGAASWFSDNWAYALPGVLYAAAHIMAVLPVGDKLPPFLKQLADVLAANYGNTRNGQGK